MTSVRGRTFRADERHTIEIALTYPRDNVAECVACGGEADGSQGLPVDDFGDVVENDDDRWTAAASACKGCHDAHRDGGLAGLATYVQWTRDEMRARRHRGTHYYRVAPDSVSNTHPNGAREKAIADAWAEENREGSILERLALVPCDEHDPGAIRSDGMGRLGLGPHFERFALEGGVTERDHIVAATVIQWLGTNVGSDWVRRAFARAGYDLRDPVRQR